MSRILVVFATRHGGTSGIAERIAEVLEGEGHEILLADAARRPDPDGFEASVVGSGVYMGSWLKPGLEFLERHQDTLRSQPVWLFSSGPLPGSTKETESSDPLDVAFGPNEGPGSGGHRRIVALADAIGVRDHRVFLGAFDPTDPPKSLAERNVRLMPTSGRILPPGDYRDWDAIEAWAREIATSLASEVPVG
jgi:menaquinone-dependent protoporphyrinogen oxidase